MRNVLGVQCKQNLPCLHAVAHVDHARGDFAGHLKGQLAFVAAAHLTGVGRGGCGRRVANGVGADDGDDFGSLGLARNIGVQGKGASSNNKHSCCKGKTLLICLISEEFFHYISTTLSKLNAKFLIIQLNYKLTC